MKEIKDMTVEEFLRDLASEAPAPGGGSASAVAGAMAAALVAFVCRKTIGKKRYAAVQEQMKAILTQAEDLKAELLVLAEKDKAVFQRVITERYSVYGLVEATLVPTETARLSNVVSGLAKTALLYGNINTQTDARIALLLAELAAVGAQLNIDVNNASSLRIMSK